ncbi:hypothetical protein EMIT0373P_40418 [Pseudomonas chlororaphis]
MKALYQEAGEMNPAASWLDAIWLASARGSTAVRRAKRVRRDMSAPAGKASCREIAPMF